MTEGMDDVKLLALVISKQTVMLQGPFSEFIYFQGLNGLEFSCIHNIFADNQYIVII